MYVIGLEHLVRALTKSHGLVVRAVTSRARRPGFNPTSFLSFSPLLYGGRKKTERKDN